MKFLKDYIADFLGLDKCITDLSGFRILVELVTIVLILAVLTSPAWLPELFGLS